MFLNPVKNTIILLNIDFLLNKFYEQADISVCSYFIIIKHIVYRGDEYMFFSKKSISFLSCVIFLFGIFNVNIFAAGKNEMQTAVSPSVLCRSAILMEASTGQVLYERNADEA